MTHWNELESWSNDQQPAVAALLELRGRVVALEAAAAPAPQPEPPTDDQRLAYLTSWLRGYIGPKSLLSADSAHDLAREMLANRILAGAPAPMEWPELPREVPECLLPDNQNSILRPLALLVWEHARSTLAEMNPDPQWEGRNDG